MRISKKERESRHLSQRWPELLSERPKDPTLTYLQGKSWGQRLVVGSGGAKRKPVSSAMGGADMGGI